MVWKPEDRELAEIWVAMELLRNADISVRYDETVPLHPREWVSLYNAHRSYIYIDGGYVRELSSVIKLLKEKVPGAYGSPEWYNLLRECLEEIASLDSLEEESRLSPKSVLDASKQASSKLTPNLAKGAAVILFGIGSAAILGTALAVVTLFEFSLNPAIVFLVFVTGYALAGYWTIESAINPYRSFIVAQIISNNEKRSKHRAVRRIFIASLAVNCFIGMFIATAIAWEARVPGNFVGVKTDEFFQWPVYVLDNLVRTAGLDTAEIFRVNVGNIEHSESMPVTWFVWSFRVILSVAGISYLFQTIRRYA